MTRGLVARTALVLVLSAAPPAATEIDRPSAREVEEAIPEGDALTGRELYDRFLRNKLHTAVQYQRVVSRDPAGNEQRTRFWVRWKDYRDENDDPGPDGVIAKTLVKFEYPFDMRNTAYLLIQRDGGTNEQFLFRPSSGRIRRVKLRGVSVFGTDFSFEDIDFQNIEDSEYHRHPDESIDSIPVYVVEATLKPQVDSEYYKIVVYLEKQHYVPLRTRIWDESSVEIKELIADPSSIQEFDGAWIATRVTMHNLREGTNSTLTVERLDPNPELADRMFGVLRLQIGH